MSNEFVSPKIEPQILFSPRDSFAQALVELAKVNPDIYVLCPDLRESLRLEKFAEMFPDRFIEMGVAEQNMLGVAAGLALSGKIPYACGFAAFNPGRNWDQLRVSVAYSRLNVKIIGSHAGVSVGPDGATHQALEDLAITRVLSGLTVIAPVDALETAKAVKAASFYKGPVYIRFGRDPVPNVTNPEKDFQIGKAYNLSEGKDISIFTNGPLLYEALQANRQLNEKGITCDIWAVPTVKPLDKDRIIASVQKTGAGIVAEEAQISGGLGGAIAEMLAENYPVPLGFIGIRDQYGCSGKSSELYDFYKLRAKNIFELVQALLKRKI